MNADQILSEILYQKGFYKTIGVKAVTVESWKNRFKNNLLSTDKKEEILRLANYIKIKESLWKLNK